jgi:spore germination cell wall hydrolase CwlJ-like protein
VSARHVAGAKDILALTLWGEAAGYPVRAVEAVATTIMNRVRIAARPEGPTHLGVGVIGVCRAPFQFACWNPNHPRHRALAESLDDPMLDACHRIAARAIAGLLPDLTHGATHYHPRSALPGWAIGRPPTVGLGGLVFYRLLG